jgi:hypothetical protein
VKRRQKGRQISRQRIVCIRHTPCNYAIFEREPLDPNPRPRFVLPRRHNHLRHRPNPGHRLLVHALSPTPPSSKPREAALRAINVLYLSFASPPRSPRLSPCVGLPPPRPLPRRWSLRCSAPATGTHDLTQPPGRGHDTGSDHRGGGCAAWAPADEVEQRGLHR